MKLKVSLLILVALALGLTVLIDQRVNLLLLTMATSEPPPLLEPQDQGVDVNWFDDYYTVQAIDEKTFAIGEPRYFQKNFNYLIVGESRAIVFDAGTGQRAIDVFSRSRLGIELSLELAEMEAWIDSLARI